MVFLFSALVADSDSLTVVFCSTSRSKVFDWETVSTMSFIECAVPPVLILQSTKELSYLEEESTSVEKKEGEKKFKNKGKR